MAFSLKSPILVLVFLCLFGADNIHAQGTADKLVAAAQVAQYEGFGELNQKVNRQLVDKLPFSLNYFKAEADIVKGASYLVYYKKTIVS